MIENAPSPFPSPSWRHRKIQTKRMRVGDVLPNPLNPKVHPDSQLDPLRGLLETVGQVDDLKAYYSERAGGRLVFFDGHGRQSLDPEAEWDVSIYDLSDAEADIVLATFDPIARQAQTNQEALSRLMSQISENLEVEDFQPPDMAAFLQVEQFMIEAARAAGLNLDGSAEAGAFDAQPPEEFKRYDENIETSYQCPKCAYEWSGKPK